MSAHPPDAAPRRLPIVAAFVCLSLASGILGSVIIPPWQAPDEPRHLEYATLLSEKGWFLTREDLSLDLQPEIMASMLESNFWTLLGRAKPDSVPASFSDDPFLRLSGSRLDDQSPLYYLLPALAFSALPEGDLLARLYLLRWFSVLLSAAAVGVAGLTAIELFPDDRFMVVAVPAFLALTPMFIFVGSSANNDSLAVLSASLVTWQIARVFNRGLSRRSGLTLCGLAILSLLAKRTSFFTVPLVALAVAIYLRHRRLPLSERQRCILATSCLLGLLLISMLLASPGKDAAHWAPFPASPVQTRSDTVARSGEHSLHAQDGGLLQALPFNTVRALRGKTVTLEAWIESPVGRQRGALLVQDDQGRSAKVLVAGPGWERYEVTYEVSPSARTMRLVLRSAHVDGDAGAGLYFDDLSLIEAGRPQVNWLQNASAETPALRIESHLDGVARYLTSSQLLDPRSYDPASLQRYLLYALLAFAGFWANFGWLTLPLDPRWYALLALATLISASGLVLWIIETSKLCLRRGLRSLSLRDAVLLVFVLGFLLLLLQTFVPMIGSQWQPQGRYLFPGLVIIATLFSFGLRRLTSWLRPELLTAAYVTGFLLLDALCLVGYVIPHYYG
jgi:hypothetical protein